MGNKNTIYALVDPRTDEVRYIGNTVDIKHREKSHLTCKKLPNNPRLMKWLQELRDIGLKFQVKIIGVIQSDNDVYQVNLAGACERHFIKWFREYNRHHKKKPLLNILCNPDYKRTKKGHRLRPHVMTD